MEKKQDKVFFAECQNNPIYKSSYRLRVAGVRFDRFIELMRKDFPVLSNEEIIEAYEMGNRMIDSVLSESIETINNQYILFCDKLASKAIKADYYSVALAAKKEAYSIRTASRVAEDKPLVQINVMGLEEEEENF